MARAQSRARGRPTPPELAGHEVVGPLGFGTNGPAWLARTTAGLDVVVSVLPMAAGPTGRAQLRRLAALRHATHPHVAQIREVVAMDGDRCAVVSGRVHGPSLATVVRARGSLTEPELYALVQALGGALAFLHARGVIHGDVAPANVVLDADGSPVLIDLAGQVAHELGTEGFVPPERRRGAPATAPGDVWALARLVQWAAGPTPPRPVIDLLGEALRAGVDRRPGARDLARSATAAHPYRPITLPSAAALAQARMQAPDAVTRRRPAGRRDVRAGGGAVQRRWWRRRTATAGEPSGGGVSRRARGLGDVTTRRSVEVATGATGGGTSRRPAGVATGANGGGTSRRPAGVAKGATGGGTRRAARHAAGAQRAPVRLAVGAVATGVVVLGLVGLVAPPGQWFGGDDISPGERLLAPSAAAGLVTGLLDTRDHALIAQDPEVLASVSVPASPSARSDAALLDALVTSGTTLTGLETSVVEVHEVVEVAEGIAVDAVLAQAQHGRVVAGTSHTVPPPPPSCRRIVLAAQPEDGDPWRMLETRACD